MIKFDYTEYQLHKKEHREFLNAAVDFSRRVMNRDYIITDLLEYLKQWFDKHIQGSDKKYAECFNKHGLV